MSEFPHLKLPYRVEGIAKATIGGSRSEHAKLKTETNKNNRVSHAGYLQESLNKISESWLTIKKETQELELTSFKENIIPLYLQIDTEVFNLDSLRHWGIELISEEQNGYIIGASVDNFQMLKNNVEAFLNNQGQRKDKAAQIWEIVVDDTWRKLLLKGILANTWDNIEDDEVLRYEIGISFTVVSEKQFPKRENFVSEADFQTAISEYDQHMLQLYIERDEKVLMEEEEIRKIVEKFGGVVHDIWDSQTDAVHFKLSTTGLGIKHILKQVQSLYEIRLDTEFSIDNDSINFLDSSELSIIPPPANASRICVIDSGIQESHRLIRDAIETKKSKSYVDGDLDVSDKSKGSGHGTKVAGAILYPKEIPTNGNYQLETVIQNARILDANCEISETKFAPKLMEEIVKDFYPDTRIFNLSVSERYAYDDTHMPALAASIDKLIHEKDILFIIATGNLNKSNSSTINPGIEQHLGIGNEYPSYLDLQTSKIANPSVSFFAISVGSISEETFEDENQVTLAGRDRISPFSRTGLGLWDSIKPDVVEYGGDFIRNKNPGIHNLTLNGLSKPELVNSTLNGSPLTGIDIGTSFSTPKVSYIISKLQSAYPDEKALMYKALLIQSARLPSHCFFNPSLTDLKYYGYGIPSLERALNNTKNRITFIQNGKVGPKKGDIYRIIIPKEMRGEQDNFKILVEVTLAFTSKVRLTRKGAHNYLANWIEWKSSKYNERFNVFRNRTIEYIETNTDVIEEDDHAGSIKWVLRENPRYNSAFPINRNNSSVQKSWAIISPHQFAEEFSLAVIGHAGWDKNLSNEVSYALCVSFETIEGEKEIYTLMEQAQIEIEAEQEVEV